MNIFIPGGAGYIGSWLVPHLLTDHKVKVLDTMWFGDAHLPTDNGNLEVIRGDVRETEAFAEHCKGQDVILYFASISSDAMCQKNWKLQNEVNAACFRNVVKAVRTTGNPRFIFASSVAVYGSTKEPCGEGVERVPTTLYSQGKIACEDILKASDLDWCITRSASVCGYAPNMRFDLTINRMVHDAYRVGHIQVNGGMQFRTHVSIKDLTNFYKLLIESKEFPRHETFNVVAANQEVLYTAHLVQDALRDRGREIPVLVGPATDDRSYMVDGKKARDFGFSIKHPLREAINDVCDKFESQVYWTNTLNPSYWNINEELAA